MGVNDLSSSIEAYFHHFEGILLEQSTTLTTRTSILSGHSLHLGHHQNSASPSVPHFPRHGFGHLILPLENIFSAGGAQGGNWRASGYEVNHLPPPPHVDLSSNTTNDHLGSISSQLGAIEGSVHSHRSFKRRQLSHPTIRLDSEFLNQSFLPLMREARVSIESIHHHLILPTGREKLVPGLATDEILITHSEPSSSSKIKSIARLDPKTVDSLIVEVLQLIETVGSLLASTENLDLGSSLEVDLDEFVWFYLIDQDQTNRLKEVLIGESGYSPDHINLVFSQLQFARRLVNNFQRSKQSTYEIMAELVHTTQLALTSGGSFWSNPTPSPAQPISVSPLFTIYHDEHHPTYWCNSHQSVESLVKLVRQVTLCLESFNASIHALLHEVNRQIHQDIKLGPINRIIKNGLFSTRVDSNYPTTNRPDSTTRSDPSIAHHNTPHGTLSSRDHPNHSRMKSHSNPSHFRTIHRPPSSPRITHPSAIRASDGGLAELEISNERTHSHELSLDGSQRHGSGSTFELDPDQLESSFSKSPTRSKKLAKFFGEDAAAQVMANPPKSMTSAISTINKPAFLLADYGPDDISFNVDHQIRGGSLRGLVIKLTSHEGPDVPFLRVFLMTYRTFTTSHDFLDFLIERYHQKPPADLTPEELQLWTDQKQKVIKIRVINVIRSWIESHLSDEDADSIIQRVIKFSAQDMGDTNLARQVALTCERRLSRVGSNRLTTPVNPPGNPPPPILPRNLRKIKFLDIDPLELARQLSLVESKLFCQIQVNECLGKAWPKEFAKEGTPNIKAMIDMSNALTRWVAETILLQPEQKKRASTIKHFILVADRCRSLNNFSTLMQIIAGLNSTPIYRLRRTWETIPQKILTLFSQLGSVMSPTKNYAAYRETIRNMAPPCVPFVGVYLTDWTFIGDGNPDFLREKPGQINFNKRQKAAELIVQIQSYQSMPYHLTPVPVIVKFLEESLENPKDEKQLYDLSLELEPRERDDEKIARLLAESGFL